MHPVHLIDWLPLTAIIAQRMYYGTAPPSHTLLEGEDLEDVLALAER